MKVAVWFSCGAASAAALKLTVDKYGADNVYAVNNPVVEEHYDNKRFAEDVAKLSLKNALVKSGRKAILLIGMCLGLRLMSATGMTAL